MVKQWNLPAGVSLEDVTEYALQVERKRHREWNRNNPEKVIAQRIRTYCNFLSKHGYTVIPPAGGITNE